MENRSKYSVLTYLFLLLSIFVLFLFTKNAYYSVKENSQAVTSIKEQLAKKEEDYKKLTQIKKDIEA
jgi:cell division protein FtsB